MESARGSASITSETNLSSMLIPAIVTLYRRIVDPKYPVRRMNITCNRVTEDSGVYQLGLFDDPKQIEHDRNLQHAMLGIKKKFGKNAVIKGMNLEEAATGRERNRQIGGHKSGEK